MSLKGKLQFTGLSDTGRVRSHNEDAIGLDLDFGLVVLADGMGGDEAGEVASALAVQTITEEVAKNIREVRKQKAYDSGYAPETILLRNAILKANANIHQA